MPVFEHPEFDAHEEVAFCHDAESGLKAIIAIHNTNLGPSLGGCRFWPYASEAEALTDVLRLSRGMTYKAALAGLAQGGGKAVIIGDPARDKSPSLLRAFGRFVDSLGGRYTTAEDVGMSTKDVEIVAECTSFASGIESKGGGDPGPATAYGVFKAIESSVAYGLKKSSVKGLRIAVQGLGSVGRTLCNYLNEAGASLIVTDIDAERLRTAEKSFGARVVAPAEIYGVETEVFAPCAMGAILNAKTIPMLKAKIVAGSANNQLATQDDAARLTARGILYAPDYAINAGGIIFISNEGPAFDSDRAMAQVAAIGETLTKVLERADATGMTTAEAADQIAEERFRGRNISRADDAA